MKRYSGHDGVDVREYLFIDMCRLTSYFQQIKRGPHVHRKVPTWSAKFGIAGPSVEVSQQRDSREPTVYEMIDEVLEFLRTHRMLERGAHNDYDNPFEVRSFWARRVTLFASSEVPIPGRDRLAFWISDKTPVLRDVHGTVHYQRFYLVESSPDDDPKEAHGVSAFGALRFLLSSESSIRVPLCLAFGMRDLIEAPYPISPLVSNEHYLRTPEEKARSEFYQFDVDPIGYLRRKELLVGDKRKVESLFRRRLESYGSDSVAVKVGYPVYVALAECTARGKDRSSSTIGDT